MTLWRWLVLGLVAACTPEDRTRATRMMDEPVEGHGRLSVPSADREVRGVWVTRWSYQRPEDLDAILDDCASAGLTHVFLQVRGRFDAFYPSKLEPWASELSGTLGVDPGWDPLEYAVRGAHERGLQLHAWMNVYAMWQGTGRPKSQGVPHALLGHPDWRVLDRSGRPTEMASSAYVFASPGNPEVADHVVAVVTDVATRYDVDGIHLDYVRYPGREFGWDPASRAAAGELDGEAFDQWRRERIRETVARMHQASPKPLSAAVWGVYQDTWGWRVGGGFDNYFQDSHGMLDDGSLTALAPMIYWPVAKRRGAKLDFATLARDHVLRAGTGGIWAGIEADKLSWDEVESCIVEAREAGARGFVLFEFKALRDKGWLDDLAGLLR